MGVDKSVLTWRIDSVSGKVTPGGNALGMVEGSASTPCAYFGNAVVNRNDGKVYAWRDSAWWQFNPLQSDNAAVGCRRVAAMPADPGAISTRGIGFAYDVIGANLTATPLGGSDPTVLKLLRDGQKLATNPRLNWLAEGPDGKLWAESQDTWPIHYDAWTPVDRLTNLVKIDPDSGEVSLIGLMRMVRTVPLDAPFGAFPGEPAWPAPEIMTGVAIDPQGFIYRLGGKVVPGAPIATHVYVFRPDGRLVRVTQLDQPISAPGYVLWSPGAGPGDRVNAALPPKPAAFSPGRIAAGGRLLALDAVSKASYLIDPVTAVVSPADTSLISGTVQGADTHGCSSLSFDVSRQDGHAYGLDLGYFYVFEVSNSVLIELGINQQPNTTGCRVVTMLPFRVGSAGMAVLDDGRIALGDSLGASPNLSKGLALLNPANGELLYRALQWSGQPIQSNDYNKISWIGSGPDGKIWMEVSTERFFPPWQPYGFVSTLLAMDPSTGEISVKGGMLQNCLLLSCPELKDKYISQGPVSYPEYLSANVAIDAAGQIYRLGLASSGWRAPATHLLTFRSDGLLLRSTPLSKQFSPGGLAWR